MSEAVFEKALDLALFCTVSSTDVDVNIIVSVSWESGRFRSRLGLKSKGLGLVSVLDHKVSFTSQGTPNQLQIILNNHSM